MELFLIPEPQRCIRLTGLCTVGPDTPVVLAMPERDERLCRAAAQLFRSVRIVQGHFALYSENSFAPNCPVRMPEGYLLSLRGDTLQLCGTDAAGLFYGLQTLCQYFQLPAHPSLEITDWPDLAVRSDYLDMRGLFPSFGRILEYIREMAHFKLNTLVIEYEDKLPRKRREFCHPLDALTREQLDQLLQTAHDHFIDVIPLQQSFGHLEYALKLPEYKHLREVPDAPGELCPLREGSFELAASLIEETAEMHPESRYLHLGCDEVWSLGQSPECRQSGLSRSRIAVDYINRLAQKVKSLGKTPIVWHDMLTGAQNDAGTFDAISRLDRDLVVAVWLYSPETVNTDAPPLMEALHARGIRTIPCCSVRAYDRCGMQNYPRVEQRLRNVDAWCELISKTRCDGMINTNWCSTFSHGNPYGLFETSRYTAFYAADRCWNLRADSHAFWERFMGVYHGVYDVCIVSGDERRYDYYKLIGAYLPKITRHSDIARLIDLMYRMEDAVLINCSAFRGDFFPDSSVELDCLRERAPKQYRILSEMEAELRELLPLFLPQHMADLFFESRSYPNRLYRRELERLLGMPLQP